MVQNGVVAARGANEAGRTLAAARASVEPRGAGVRGQPADRVWRGGVEATFESTVTDRCQLCQMMRTVALPSSSTLHKVLSPRRHGRTRSVQSAPEPGLLRAGNRLAWDGRRGGLMTPVARDRSQSGRHAQLELPHQDAARAHALKTGCARVDTVTKFTCIEVVHSATLHSGPL